jgi:hypothetical protein
MWAGGEGWEAGWYVKEGDLFVLLWKPAGASRAGGESQAESQEGRGGPRLGGAPFPRRKRKGEAQFLLPCRPLPAWPPQDSERFLALLQAARTGLCCIPTSPDSWRWMQSVAGGDESGSTGGFSQDPGVRAATAEGSTPWCVLCSLWTSFPLSSITLFHFSNL